MVKHEQALIVGASIAGLAAAATLKKEGIGFVIIDKAADFAAPWRQHYERLHLHTHKNLSGLPFKPFDGTSARYPSRLQVLDYLESYRREFNIEPFFNTAAHSIKREGGLWITETGTGLFSSKYLIMATGAYSKPRRPEFPGMKSFPGPLLHSHDYKRGSDFKLQRVLVVGFGNSACEIALDLFEQGALPFMAVRSAVNVVPRDLLGVPVQRISLLLSKLPAGIADAISAPLIRLALGDLARLGLQKKRYGPFEGFRREGRPPVLDIGTIKHIRLGHIGLYPGIDHISGRTVCFANGQQDDFDAIVAATGYDRQDEDILQAGIRRFDDLRKPAGRQQYFGEDGLYFCGFWISPAGQIREIARDAKRIADDIARRTR